MKKDIKIDFDEFVNIFNEKGKGEAINLAREKYNLSFCQIKRRLVNGTDYYFDLSKRIYKHKDPDNVGAEFMSIEELQNRKPKKLDNKESVPLLGHMTPPCFDDLVMDLIKDRIIEISQYISIDRGSKKLIVRSEILKNNGLELVVI